MRKLGFLAFMVLAVWIWQSNGPVQDRDPTSGGEADGLPAPGATTSAHPKGDHPVGLSLPEPTTAFRRARPEARLLASRVTENLDGGSLRRIRLWSVREGPYTRFRTVEYWRVPADPRAGVPEFLGSEAMLADHLALSVTPSAVETTVAELDAMGLDVVRRYPFSPVWQVRLSEAGLDAVSRWRERLRGSLGGAASVTVSPDYLFFPTATEPNDPRYADQWFWPVVDAPSAWELNTGSTDVIVAVIDSGLFTDEDAYTVHNDFLYAGGNNLWINPEEDLDGDGALNDSGDLNGIDDDGNGLIDDLSGWDFYNDDPIAEDLAGHGTEVSGLIGAAGDNSYGISGASWRVALLPLKAGDFEYPWSVLAHCLDYARSLREAGHPVLITNHSYGDTLFAPEPLYEQALERARDAGLLVVAAAGNGGFDLDNSAGRFLPAEAAQKNILAVASTDEKDRLAASSNFGEESVDLASPGEAILTLDRNGGFRQRSGTSFAAALVSGAAALLLKENPDLDYAQIRELLMRNGDFSAELDGNIVDGRRINFAASVELTAVTAEPYAYWQWRHWRGDFVGRPESQPEADPDRDGAFNWLEYHLQTDPLNTAGSNELPTLAQPRLEAVAHAGLGLPEGRYGRLRFRRNARAPIESMRFLSAVELEEAVEWTVETPALLETVAIPGMPETERVKAFFDLPEDMEAKFFRVEFPHTHVE